MVFVRTCELPYQGASYNIQPTEATRCIQGMKDTPLESTSGNLAMTSASMFIISLQPKP